MKALPWIISGVLAALLILFLWNQKKLSADFVQEIFDPKPDPGGLNCDRQIGMDSTGAEVLYFQQYYNDHRPGFGLAIAEDGVYGSQTQGAAAELGLSAPFSLSALPNGPCA